MKLALLDFSDNIVLRIPILYGDVEYLEESAVTVLLKSLKDVQGIHNIFREGGDINHLSIHENKN